MLLVDDSFDRSIDDLGIQRIRFESRVSASQRTQFICFLVEAKKQTQIKASTMNGISMIQMYLKLSAKPRLSGVMLALMISAVTPGIVCSAAVLPEASAGLRIRCQLHCKARRASIFT